MTYDEYRITQMLSPDLLPMTATFYELLTDRCRHKQPPPSAATGAATSAPQVPRAAAPLAGEGTKMP